MTTHVTAEARTVRANGIDIGPVELVCQIASPRSLATFLQRVGRSGHSRGGTPKGRLFPMTRDELVECCALLAGVRAGRLDGQVVDSVLRAAGHRVRRRREWPAGLTGREVEVLRLVCRGLSNKQIASALQITPKTASSHIEHIYRKIDVANRAQASIFAMRHGLMVDAAVAAIP